MKQQTLQKQSAGRPPKFDEASAPVTVTLPLRTLEALRPLGWEPSRFIPHGGHQMSLNIAAGLGLGGNESYPDLFQPFGGFPDGVVVEDGYITMQQLPGIGFEGKADLAHVCAELMA